MEIYQLRYVAALSRTLNFRKAAEITHVTQPTLSQQIQKLEEELGVQLFERGPRFVLITPAGKEFVSYAKSILDLAEQAVEAASGANDDPRGTLAVGAIPTIAPYLLPGALNKLDRIAPKLTIELYEDTTSILIERLKGGLLDIGLVSLPIDDAALKSESLGVEPFFVAAHKNHRLAQSTGIRVADLIDERMLMLQEGHCFRDQSLSFCRKENVDPQIVFQGGNLGSILSLVSFGIGITLAPSMLVERNIHSGVAFIPFDSNPPTREIGLIYRNNAVLTAKHKAFAKSVRRII